MKSIRDTEQFSLEAIQSKVGPAQSSPCLWACFDTACFSRVFPTTPEVGV